MPCWFLANLLFLSVIRYGAYFTVLTGLLQLLACLLWASIRNINPLIIPFEDGYITTKYGVSFWLTFTSGDAVKNVSSCPALISYCEISVLKRTSEIFGEIYGRICCYTIKNTCSLQYAIFSNSLHCEESQTHL